MEDWTLWPKKVTDEMIGQMHLIFASLVRSTAEGLAVVVRSTAEDLAVMGLAKVLVLKLSLLL